MIVAAASCHPPDYDPRLEGRLISIVSFQYRGQRTVSEERMLERMISKPGTRYSAGNLDADLKSLWESGLIQDLHFEPKLVDESVKLTVIVTPPPACGPSPFVGNFAFSDQKLAQVTGIKIGKPFDFSAAEKIETFYHRNGYPDATVAIQVNKENSTPQGTFVFQINEGFKGEPAPPPRALHPR